MTGELEFVMLAVDRYGSLDMMTLKSISPLTDLGPCPCGCMKLVPVPKGLATVTYVKDENGIPVYLAESTCSERFLKNRCAWRKCHKLLTAGTYTVRVPGVLPEVKFCCLDCYRASLKKSAIF